MSSLDLGLENTWMRLRPLLITLAALATPPALAAEPAVPMAAHRAVYKLSLDTSRGDVSSATGCSAVGVTGSGSGGGRSIRHSSSRAFPSTT